MFTIPTHATWMTKIKLRMKSRSSDLKKLDDLIKVHDLTKMLGKVKAVWRAPVVWKCAKGDDWKTKTRVRGALSLLFAMT